MLLSNHVAEQLHIKSNSLYLVSAEWRGGHDRRVIRLRNIYDSYSEAKARWDELTIENHNRAYNYPDDFDSGFLRLPMRIFNEDIAS